MTSCSGSATRGGGEGSATTETVSAIVASTAIVRSPARTSTSPFLRAATVPSSPGAIPVDLWYCSSYTAAL
jgi:hypothetical protein